MINCRNATRLLSDAQDRKLSLQERTALRLHLMMCSACRNFGKQMESLRSLTRSYVKGTKIKGKDDSE